jgi:hypothetical protein
LRTSRSSCRQAASGCEAVVKPEDMVFLMD